ncbi:hypothetical protein K438DRAFT_1998515 [Mycena galopus ATCC 62051]|nr:hypothetical protein K438DRAFT_1998515 [Mycena galopus ATCC 62051]
MTVSHDSAEAVAFLESFTPSLRYLRDDFVRAGILNKEHLVGIAKWDEGHMREFFTHGFHATENGRPLKAVVIEALIIRLSYHSCDCGSCADPLPVKRTCPDDPVARSSEQINL